MKSSRILTLLAVVGLVSLFANEAMAQRRRGGGAGMMQMFRMMNSLPVTMLGMEEVQKELEFTDEQKKEVGEKATEMMSEFRESMRDAMQGGDGMEGMEEMIEELKEAQGTLVEKLNDDQKKRLKQLGYQRLGMAMYSDKDAAKKIGLSEDQSTSITDAIAEMGEKRQEAMQNAMSSGDREGVREALEELNEELEKTVMGVLTDEQKEKAEEMVGEKFEFPQRRRGGGGRRRSDF